MSNGINSGGSARQIIRLTQIALGDDKYRVEIALVGTAPRQTAPSQFSFAMTAQDHEDIRWYLENYLENPLDPAPSIAKRIEQRLTDIGTELFGKIFSGRDAVRLWNAVSDSLAETRVEIITTDVSEAASIPWELLRDPATDSPLALKAATFVRTQPQTAQRPRLPEPGPAEAIRILLVICRPYGRVDVPFRSVASRLIKGLEESSRESFQLDVLRPATYEALGKKLRAAKNAGKPYHVVHFDGHGTYDEISRPELMLSPEREGAHGYLLFENPRVEENCLYVDGPTLGSLLADTNVQVMDLNACRSAFAKTPDKPVAAGADFDRHAAVRAYGSLAQELVDQGVAGVVAMRYNVYVVTAAQYVAGMYAELVRGHSLGEAATLARKNLADQPQRQIAYEPTPLQDWCVPVIWEAAPIRLFSESTEKKITFTLGDSRTAPGRDDIDEAIKERPDVGFFGRDETLLALDRAFDSQRVVLLSAYAGSGKTETAREFARWYSLTGGVEGPVFFTSFERHQTLAQLLGRLEPIYEQMRGAQLPPWMTLKPAEKRSIALQILKQVPLLWIWDNVEPIAGFPEGAKSAWSPEEQAELVDFLRDARQTQAKFLLTSRRDERGWLHDLPARLTLPPMPMRERIQLTRELAAKQNRRLGDVQDWRPLLDYTAGNPMTITVVVGQALRDRLTKPDQIEAYVNRLRAGEAEFTDDKKQGRTRSLGASLSYGFENAFSEKERRILALLHLFQGFVDVDALKLMGDEEDDWHLPEVNGLTREKGISLLDRAAEIGLLTAHGDGYYSIHPALPWFFKSEFGASYPERSDSDSESPAMKATHAFVEAVGELGIFYSHQYEGGNRDVIAALTAEEANLLHARHLAIAHDWFSPIITTMQGLRPLYDQTGRRTEWKQLVEEILPLFVDEKTDGPLPEREGQWSIVTQYRVLLAREERDLETAERLQLLRIEWNRRRAASALKIPKSSLNERQRNAIRTLATSLHELGQIQREVGRAECVKTYEEDFELSMRIGDRAGAAVTAINLGTTYIDLPDLRNLDEAARWCQKSHDLSDKRDRLGRGRCTIQLGTVALERFEDAHQADRPEKEQRKHLNEALGRYYESLELLPENAVDNLAVIHNQLGIVYVHAGDVQQALRHYDTSVKYKEEAGNVFGAGQTRYNVALLLANANRLPDALAYAKAALRDFDPYGDRAKDMIEKTQRLIAQIKKDISKQGQGK
ncbi:MAG: CHAT domain-containing protein [bacterium]